MENAVENISESKNILERGVSNESYDNECNEYINSELKHYCDLPSAIQTGIVDRIHGDIVSVNNSSNIHVGAKIGKVIVDTFTVVSSAKEKSSPRKQKLIIALLSCLCLTAIVCCVVYFAFIMESDPGWFVKREQWGARNAKNPCTDSEDKQVVEVIIFQAKTSPCFDFNTCSHIIRDMQVVHQTDIYASDIKFNFIIGGDGKVYEGLDWHCKGEYVFLPFSSLHIGIIGDYSEHGLNNSFTEGQKNALFQLFKYGVEKQKLYEKFGVSPACCYKKASDPGENVLRDMVHWPEYIRSCLHSEDCDYSHISDFQHILSHNRTEL